MGLTGPRRATPARPRRRGRRPDAGRARPDRTSRPLIERRTARVPSSDATIACISSAAVPRRRRSRRAAAGIRRRARRRARVRPRAPGLPPRRECSRSAARARRVVDPDLSGNDTLTRGRNALFDGNRGRDALAEPEPAQAGARQHQRVESARIELGSRVSTLPRMGANVARSRSGAQLRRSAHAAGADRRARPRRASASEIVRRRAGGAARARRADPRAAGTPRRPVRRAAPPACPSRCGRRGRHRRAGARLRAP